MQELLSIILIGVSLSMDTFSLSLSMGSLIRNNKYLKFFPFIVGIFHFFMPIIGNKIGISIMNYFKKEEININLSFISILFLAFSVSIDSFTVGLGISDITNKFMLSSFIFSVCSFSFTSLGLIIGKYSSKLIGNYASIIGILLLILLGIFHIL